MLCPSSVTTYFCLQWECRVPLPGYPFTYSSCTMPWQKAGKDIVLKSVCVLSKPGIIWEDHWIFYSWLTHKASYNNMNNFPTFNFSPVDSNFCYRYSQALSYIKQFHIKCPEEKQEITSTVTLTSRRKMVALLIKSLAWFKDVGVQLWSW